MKHLLSEMRTLTGLLSALQPNRVPYHVDRCKMEVKLISDAGWSLFIAKMAVSAIKNKKAAE